MACDLGKLYWALSTTWWHFGQADSIQLTVEWFYEMLLQLSTSVITGNTLYER